ncbi:MAG: hypothetical protein KDA60_03070, partial [Planctomycetales bacterium]|nr:hypothetical protein [Planctomycetales bacterium]
MMNRIVATGAALLVAFAFAAQTHAQGVTAGLSSLFDTIDYGDTFTGTDDGGIPGRPYVAAGLPEYPIENSYGNPSTHYVQQPGSAFSIASDLGPGFVQGTTPLYPTDLGGNASGAGSDTGFTQTGGNNLGFGVEYYLRDEFVVQVDAVQVTDRVDITAGGIPGGTMISAPNSLSIFFRGDGSGNASLYNGSIDTPIQGQPGYESFNTGIAAWNDAGNGGQSRWYNYAVRFDQPNNEVELFVNQNSLAVIDLNTFAGGTYASGFANHFVSVSTGTGDRTWTDNFQVGGFGATTGMPPQPHPDPGNLIFNPANFSGPAPLAFWDFNEANGPVEGRSLNFAYDRAGDRDGSFLGTAARTDGLIGTVGAGRFNNTDGDAV